MTKTFDFNKVEELRKHMKLRKADMANLFGVSRVQYDKWIKTYNAGEAIKIRDVNLKRIRDGLDGLVWVLREHNWPHGTELMQADARYHALKLLLQEQP